MRDDLKKLAKESNPTRKQMKERRVAEYVRAEVLPWAGAFERQRAGDFRMVIGSDFHGLEVDGFAMATFLDVIKRVKPEVIVLNGDVVDFGAVSSWPKNPNSRRLLDLEDRLYLKWFINTLIILFIILFIYLFYRFLNKESRNLLNFS